MEDAETSIKIEERHRGFFCLCNLEERCGKKLPSGFRRSERQRFNGKEEEDGDDGSTAWEILELLGTIKTIHSHDAEQFAENVKPYLDSSGNLQRFRAWPLSTEVRFFVKALIPQERNAVESHAEVANKYSQKLEITAIVTPPAAPSTGKPACSWYHQKSFCVVISQVDEIDCDVFIKGDAQAKQIQDLRNDKNDIRVLTERSAVLKTQLRNEEKDLVKAEEKLAKANTMVDSLTPKRPGSLAIKREENPQSYRTQKSLDETEWQLARYEPGRQESRWDCPRSVTGIPRFRQWLVDSTSERRQEQLDALLNALQRLFSSIHCWSLINSDGNAIHIPHDLIEDLLSRTHKKSMEELESQVDHGFTLIETLDPFNQKDYARKLCKRESAKAATSARVGLYYGQGREKRDYNFPEAMAVALLENVLEVWHKTCWVEIPSAKRSIPEFLGSLRDQLAPMLEASLQFVGTGHFQQRRRYLYECVREESNDIFDAGYNKMHRKYKNKVAQLLGALAEMVSFAGVKVRTQIALMLDGLEDASGKEWAVAATAPADGHHGMADGLAVSQVE
ncbi:hypothetical protein N657DRAFT_667766 [Parathielavia appendiculata]|uniref:Uncharacterized protein n=1 Tax=Parathielavia appendiculata TaxID=2587402 RepID=A0AAN6UBI8_9PEZI|nr:hypothetical protein N657DRAFT_667766 [Parathielavia appendiculata]